MQTYKYRFTIAGANISGEIKAIDYGAALDQFMNILNDHNKIEWDLNPKKVGKNFCVQTILELKGSRESMRPASIEEYQSAEDEYEACQHADKAGVLGACILIALIIVIGVFGGDLLIKLFKF